MRAVVNALFPRDVALQPMPRSIVFSLSAMPAPAATTMRTVCRFRRLPRYLFSLRRYARVFAATTLLIYGYDIRRTLMARHVSLLRYDYSDTRSATVIALMMI